MQKIIALFCLCLFLCLFPEVNAQKAEWQQQVDVELSVRLDAEKKILKGEVRMQYINNSPDDLDRIYIHLWPNAYSRYNSALAIQLLQQGNLAMSTMGREDLGAIGKLQFEVDGESVEFEYDDEHSDIAVLKLKEAVPSGASVEIYTPFSVKVPKLISRMAYVDDYFAISQWFPKPAVYDEDGWHPMPYLDQGEFYAEFGRYTVTIDVPENYKVAATGKRIKAIAENGRKILMYKEQHIHDFAWFASPDFKYDSREIELPNGRKVTLEVYYETENANWLRSLDIAEESITYFSEKIGNYPYEYFTIVEGPLQAGAAMEYQTITVVSESEDVEWFEKMVVHEVAHNWFQGMLASNERIHPWIDEGLTTYYENRFTKERSDNPFEPQETYTKRKLAKLFDLQDVDFDQLTKTAILQEQRMNRHQSCALNAQETTSWNYALNHYAKVPYMFEHLQAYLGTEAFDACMQTLFERYQFRHLGPDDLKDHLEACSGKSLNYLFDKWIGTNGIIDAKLGKIDNSDQSSTTVSIVQKGDFSVPVEVRAESEEETQTVWVEDGQKSAEFNIQGIRKITLDPENRSLDYNRNNNFLKTYGFKRLERIRLQPLASIEHPDKSQLFGVPMFKGNKHDGIMLGLALYNRVYPAKNVDWNIVPLWAFGSKQINGIFNFTYYQNIRKKRHVQLAYDIHFRTFNYSDEGRFVNFRPSLTATILPENRVKNIKHVLQLTHHQNWIEVFVQDGPDAPSVKQISGQGVGELRYTMIRDDAKLPIKASLYAFNNKDFLMPGAELMLKVRYGKIKSFVSARFFIEGFVYKRNEFVTPSNLGYPTYRSGLGGTTGETDYLFENHFYSRNGNDGFASSRLYMDRGQFKFVNEGLLRANALVTSLNIRADFPSKWVPIKLYADFGLAMNEPASGLFAFQAGGMISLLNGGFEVYFPFFSSSEIKGFYDLNVPEYKHRITFSLDFEKMNLHKKAREFSL